MSDHLSRSIAKLGEKSFRSKRSAHLTLMAFALILGILAGHAAVGFYLAIDGLLFLFYGESEAQLATGARDLPWWHIVLVPTLVGVIVGQIIRFLPGGRAGGVGEVIEATALKAGELSLKKGFLSAGATILALAGGSSTGREGPVVHLGASMASGLTRHFGLPDHATRTLLGCCVAAAVAASFNAPFAGVFFALEVIVGHYALHAFAPIVIAAIAGTVTSRAYLGENPAFVIGDYAINSAWEFPAFIILGILGALIAIMLCRSLLTIESLREQLLGSFPIWLLPPLGGAMVGGLGVFVPEVLSVGYEATSFAIGGDYGLTMLLTLLAAKFVAVVISFTSRLGSGVFSPSLFLGAMLGGSFGLIAALTFPELASDHGVYAIAGMGAVASAALGAPISTFLIVFEITGDYSITMAVMVTSAVASLTASAFGHTSIFHALLARRGIELDGGRATYLLKSCLAADHMDKDFFTINGTATADTAVPMILDLNGFPVVVTDESGSMIGTVSLAQIPADVMAGKAEAIPAVEAIARTSQPTIRATDPLKKALEIFEATGESILPVLSTERDGVVVGLLRHRAVMVEYNRALLESQGRDAVTD